MFRYRKFPAHRGIFPSKNSHRRVFCLSDPILVSLFDPPPLGPFQKVPVFAVILLLIFLSLMYRVLLQSSFHRLGRILYLRFHTSWKTQLPSVLFPSMLNYFGSWRPPLSHCNAAPVGAEMRFYPPPSSLFLLQGLWSVIHFFPPLFVDPAVSISGVTPFLFLLIVHIPFSIPFYRILVIE